VELDVLGCEADGVCEVMERDGAEPLDVVEVDAIAVEIAEEVLVVDFSVDEDAVSLEVVAEVEGWLVVVRDKEAPVSWNGKL
jgi:hypothetical protein